MKLWWCELHRAAESAEEGICEVGARMLLVPGPYPKADYPEPCEIKEMQLVPADAEVQCPNCKFVYEMEKVK